MINVKGYSNYFLFGISGILLGFITVLGLSSVFGIRKYYILIMLFISMVGFLLLGLMIKIFFGTEDHTMLRSFVVITLLQTAGAVLFDQPLLIVLDLFIIGYAVAVGIGRIGCYSVGCCHGKPAKKGICYTEQHTINGFPDRYMGKTLFPVQLIESAGLITLATISIYVSLYSEPGNAFFVFLYGYGCLRFVLEFYRGDTGRFYLFSFSEAQWTVFLLFVFNSILLYISEHYLFSFWMFIFTGILFFIILIWGLMGKFYPDLRFHEPWHIEELLSIKPQDKNSQTILLTTKLGLNISASHIDSKTALYTFSFKNNRFRDKSLDKLLEIYHLKYSNKEVVHHSSLKMQVIFIQS